MDIGHIRHQTWAKDNDVQKWVNYNQLSGQHMSALEHAVPERFFNDPAQCNAYGSTTPKPNLPDCPRGISSISALQIAASQGQRIYTITQAVYNANPGMVNTHLGAHSAPTQQRISEALNNGMEVTIHQSPISEGGWTGAGYIVSDPQQKACPIKMQKILTDNGKEFTDRLFASRERQATGNHEFLTNGAKL
jgi:hypothetical protein